MSSTTGTDKVEVIQKYLQQYSPSQHFDKLPKFLKQRVDALKKLQLEKIKLDQQFHEEMQELEIKYAKLHEPLYMKRFEIISGKYEPSDEDCKLPQAIVDYECDGDQEDGENMKDEDTDDQFPALDEKEEQEAKSKIAGIPCYWLGVLNASLHFVDSIEEHDKPILQHLSDIRSKFDVDGSNVVYILEFHFEPNSYFNQSILTKKYFLRSQPDEKDPWGYDGHELIKTEGTEIKWNDGKDPTTKTMNVRQKHKTKGTVRTKSKSVERDSFFHFFNPPQIPENREEMDEDLTALASIDFELGQQIRESIVPKSVLWYNGYQIDDEDALSDDDEFEDDSSDDDDSSDETGSDSDSLEDVARKSKPQKKDHKCQTDAKSAKADAKPPECTHH